MNVRDCVETDRDPGGKMREQSWREGFGWLVDGSDMEREQKDGAHTALYKRKFGNKEWDS